MSKKWEISYRWPGDGTIVMGVIVPSKLTQETLDSVCEYINGFTQKAPVVVELMPRNELDEFASY